jgi:Flp pilus assembly protein TadD
MARFVKDQPGNPLANFQYAMTLWKRQRISGDAAGLGPVQILLEKAITIDPRFDEAYLELGILHFAQENFEQAIGAYKKAIELNPRLGEAYYRLGIAYKRVGRKAEAAQEFKRHQQIQIAEAASVDRQRREVRQFVTVLRDQTDATSPR